MPRGRLTVADAATALEAGPRRIGTGVADVAPDRLRSERMLGTWTPTDVLAHLRSCSDVCMDVIPKLLASERPTLSVIGPRTLIETTNYRDLAFATSLRAFARQRGRLVAMFRSVPRAQWSRSARIVDRGRYRERSVADYADWLARHELRHVEQFERFGRKMARLSDFARPYT